MIFLTTNPNSKNKNLCASSQNFILLQNWEKISNIDDISVGITYLFPILEQNEILIRSTEIFIFGVRIFGKKNHKGMDWGISTKIRPDMWEQYFAVWIEPDIFFTAYATYWYYHIRRERGK